jgi:hypothetical protein
MPTWCKYCFSNTRRIYAPSDKFSFSFGSNPHRPEMACLIWIYLSMHFIVVHYIVWVSRECLVAFAACYRYTRIITLFWNVWYRCWWWRHCRNYVWYLIKGFQRALVDSAFMVSNMRLIVVDFVIQIAISATINSKVLLPMTEKNGCCCHYSYHHFCCTLNPFCSLCYSAITDSNYNFFGF